jgi:hypothetical protein
VSEIEELQTIQREAAERRAERDRERLAAQETNSGRPAGEQADSHPTGAPSGGVTPAGAEYQSSGLGNQLASVLEELEDAARDHPALALLATFSLGVIVGQLFSRR